MAQCAPTATNLPLKTMVILFLMETIRSTYQSSPNWGHALRTNEHESLEDLFNDPLLGAYEPN